VAVRSISIRGDCATAKRTSEQEYALHAIEPRRHAAEECPAEAIGFETVNDVVQVFNKGVIQESRDAVSIEYRTMKAVVDSETGFIITFSPL